MDTLSIHESAFSFHGDDHKVDCYENHVPDFVTREIDRCFGSLHSSIPYLRLAGKLSDSTCTYVATSKGLVLSIFLFERKGQVIEVLNRGCGVRENQVRTFADYIFKQIPEVSRIHFPSIHTEKIRAAYPVQRFVAEEDMVVSFGDTASEYESQLGKSTRKAIKRRVAALALHDPSWRVEVIPGNAINTLLIDDIVNWNRQRMSDKQEVSNYQDDAVARYTALAANDGFVVVVMIQGRPCAATVCCRVGRSFYMILIGHDKEYDQFSPGMLCCYWTALECVKRKGAEFNLMCGRLRYKYNLSGKCRKYDAVVIYRSRSALFRNFIEASRTAVAGYMAEARFALLNCEHEKGPAAELVARSLAVWRASKRIYRSLGPTKRS